MTTLHVEDTWELDALPRVGNNYASWIWHDCLGRDETRAAGARWAVCHCREGTCAACGAPIPDEILGLWKLHNWEQIQTEGTR